MRNLFSPKKKEPDNVSGMKQDNNQKNISQHAPREAWRPLPSPRRQQQPLWPWFFTWMILFVLLFKSFQPGVLPSPTPTVLPPSPDIKIKAPDSILAGASLQATIEFDNIDPNATEIQFLNPDRSPAKVANSIPSGNTVSVTFIVGDVQGFGAIWVREKATATVLGTKAVMIFPSPPIAYNVTLSSVSQVVGLTDFISGFVTDLTFHITTTEGAIAKKPVRIITTPYLNEIKDAGGQVVTNENGDINLKFVVPYEDELYFALVILENGQEYQIYGESIPITKPQLQKTISIKGQDSQNESAVLYSRGGAGERLPMLSLPDHYPVKAVKGPDESIKLVIVEGYVKKEHCENCTQLNVKKDMPFYPIADGKRGGNPILFQNDGQMDIINLGPEEKFVKVQLVGLIENSHLASPLP